jgi:hypothetical protein
MTELRDKMISIGGNTKYLQVQHRVLWLRGEMGEHPDAQILTEIITLDVERQYAVVKAIVSIPNGGTATAHGSALASSLPSAQRAKFLEFAETRAVGRALAMLGYSTAGAMDLDEDGADEPVDAPLRAPQSRHRSPHAPTANATQVVVPSRAVAQKLSAIKSAAEQLGWPAGQVRTLALSMGLPERSTDMTEQQAGQLLAALEERLGELAAI